MPCLFLRASGFCFPPAAAAAPSLRAFPVNSIFLRMFCTAGPIAVLYMNLPSALLPRNRRQPPRPPEEIYRKKATAFPGLPSRPPPLVFKTSRWPEPGPPPPSQNR